MGACLLQLSCASSETSNPKEPPPTSIVSVPSDIPPTPLENKTTESSGAAVSPPAAGPVPPAVSPSSAKKKKTLEGVKSIVALPASAVQILGDSTLRKYSSNATQLGLRVRVEPAPRVPEDVLKSKLSEFLLVIPVSGMKSGTDLLDEHMSEALKAKQFPEIRAAVKGYEIKGENTDGSHQVTASVDLTIAGVTRTVPVDASIFIEGETVRIKGEKQLLMTDFKIDPPTLMLGTIKTANEITIRFNLLLGLSPLTP